MGSPVVQLMLESMLAPLILAGLVLIYARGIGQGRFAALAEALAIVLAIGTTYLLAFGWPLDLVFSARMKIMLSAFGALVVGMAIERRVPWARLGLTAGAIGIPIWVGLPALAQGRPESAFLALPIAAALAAPSLRDKVSPAPSAPKTLIALTMAFGLAAIAVLARAFSFAELSLSLGSALLAILAISRQQLTAPAAITAAAILLALITALLLYSEASPMALFILGTVIGAERMAALTGSGKGTNTATRGTLVFCVLPAAAAILIARIDAGPFSLY